VSASTFDTPEAAIADDHFPEVDLMLRRGRHIGRDDGTAYDYLVDAQALLEGFYRRFACELVQQNDGYFYLLPSGDRLGRRQLSVGEMLVGQTLALLYLDPATLQEGGIVGREVLLHRLSGLVGTEALIRTLNPRKRKYDERIAAETVRSQVSEAVRRLADLGFVDALNEMLRTSMTGGISRALTSELRAFLLKEEGGLADTLARMKANLDACRRTRTEVQESRRLEQEIGAVFEAGQTMFAAAFLATRSGPTSSSGVSPRPKVRTGKLRLPRARRRMLSSAPPRSWTAWRRGAPSSRASPRPRRSSRPGCARR